MADIRAIVKDPDFGRLSPSDQRHVLSSFDSQFSSLSDSDISHVVGSLGMDFNAMHRSQEGLPGSAAPKDSGMIGELASAANKTASDFFIEPAKQIGQNAIGMLKQAPSVARTLIDPAYAANQAQDYLSEKAGHVADAAQAYRSGDIARGLESSINVTPGGSMITGAAHQLVDPSVATARGETPDTSSVGQAIGNQLTPLALGAAGRAVPAAVKPVVQAAREAAPGVAQAIDRDMLGRVSAKYFRFGANPIEAIADLKTEFGKGVQSLKPQLEAKGAKIAANVDAVLRRVGAGKQLDVEGAVNGAIDDAIGKAYYDGNDALASRLEKFREGQMRMIKDSGGTEPIHANAYKKQLGESTKFSTDPVEGSLNQVKQDIYGRVKGLINDAVPQVAPLQEKAANVITAKKVVEHAHELGLTHGADLTMNPVKLIMKALGSPYVRTRVASTLNSMGYKE